MSIFHKIGDIFTSESRYLVNPVNEVGVMGAGLALRFKIRYPKMYESYREFCHGSGYDKGIILYNIAKLRQLGISYETITESNFFWCVKLHWWEGEGGDTIINAPTKRHWKEKSSLSKVENTLSDLHKFCVWRNVASIAMPRLGCGLGGLHWDDVHNLIKMEFSPSQTDVEIWTYPSSFGGS